MKRVTSIQCALLTIFCNEHWSVIVPVFHIGNDFLHAWWINIEPIKWSLLITIEVSELGLVVQCKVKMQGIGVIIKKVELYLQDLQLGHHFFVQFVDMNPLLWRLLAQTHTLMTCSLGHRNLHSDWCQWNRVLSSVLLCHYWKTSAIHFLESSPSLLGTYQIRLDPRSCIVIVEYLCQHCVEVEWAMNKEDILPVHAEWLCSFSS